MKNNKFFFLAFVAAFLFALSTPLSKILLVHIDPILLAGIYYLGAAVLLLPFAHKNLHREFVYLKKVPGKDIARLIGAMIFGGILGPISLMWGIKLINATSASLLLNLETVATTIFAYLFFKEFIGKRIVFASLLTVLSGGLLVVSSQFQVEWGGILIVLACIFWGMDNNLTATVEGISPVTNTIFKGIGAGTFNITLFFFLGDGLIPGWNLILWAVVIGFLSYGLSIVFYISSARHLGATRSQIIFASNPFMAALLSMFLIREVLDFKFFIALSLMVISTAILFYEKHVHRHCHEEMEHEHEHIHEDGHHNHEHHGNQENDTGLLTKVKGPMKAHTHKHEHAELDHSHPHWPDIHHRHKHS